MKKKRTMSEKQFQIALGERIAMAREIRGLTQEAIAKSMNLSRTSMVNIECGRQGLSVIQLCLLARMLAVRPDKLIPNIGALDAESS